jgi:tetratricopeptide (TPR) repeat protein
VQHIGPYQVLGEIARGGMGVVFEALDPRDGRAVAIKVLLGSHLATPTQRKRFQREAEALARVRHPGVVRVHGEGLTPQGQPYLAMERVEGESAQELIARQGPLAIELALQLAGELCSAVAACHAVGVLHRDLKPDNVLLGAGRRVKLTDFGLARDADPASSRSRLTQTGQFLGSPAYWAPEQAAGRLEAVDARTDVYGLGATLFALLTGVPPHQGASLPELMDAASVAKRVPSTLNPQVPGWLDAVVARALAADPAQRFGSVVELAAALQARDARGGRAHWAVRAGVVSVAVLALAGLAWLAQGRTRAPAEASQAEADPRDEVFDRGVRLLRAKRFEEARRAFDVALRLSPTATSYSNRAYAFLGLKEWGAAIADCEAALELVPNHEHALINRGTARRGLGDLAGAEEDFSQAIRSHPESAQAHGARAAVRTELEDAQGAIDDWGALLALRPDDAQALLRRGLLRGNRGETAQALEDFDAVIRLRPDDAQAYSNRALTRMNMGDAQGAVDDASQAIRLDPDYAQAYFNRGVARGQLGQVEAALADYEATIRLAPNVFRAYVNRGKLRLDAGDARAALDDFETAIRLEPEQPIGYANREVARRRLGDFKGAVEDAEQLIRLLPESTQGYYARAVARGMSGDLQGLIDDCDRVLQRDPDHADAYYNRGLARVKLDDEAGGAADWERALELKPSAPWAGVARSDLEKVRRRLDGQR